MSSVCKRYTLFLKYIPYMPMLIATWVYHRFMFRPASINIIRYLCVQIKGRTRGLIPP